MLRLLLATAALSALGSGSGQAGTGAPYPWSDLGLTWLPASYQHGGEGGDIWPVTWGLDGQLHTAWGDGRIGCPAYVSYGTARLAGGPSADLRTTGCGPRGSGKGKLASLLATGRALYAVAYLQDRPGARSDIAVWRSTDGGRTWRKPGREFPGTPGALQPLNFVQFGRDNAGAPGRYAYLTAVRATATPKAAYLVRAPVAGLQDEAAYRYFAGFGRGGAPVWGRAPAAAEPIFGDRSGVNGPEVVYDAGLGRYLLTAAHGPDRRSGGKIGVFVGPKPWGPWRTVDYRDRWLGMRGGEYLGLRFPTTWMVDRGRTLWAVFSCHDHGACGRYDDRFNLMRATLSVPATARRSQAPPANAAVGTPR